MPRVQLPIGSLSESATYLESLTANCIVIIQLLLGSDTMTIKELFICEHINC